MRQLAGGRGHDDPTTSSIADRADVAVGNGEPRAASVWAAPADVAPESAPCDPDGDPTPQPGQLLQRMRRWRHVHPATWLVLFGWSMFALLFSTLGIRHHRAYGTWAFDMGIYDQAFWLVSRGESWITVRGIDMWGHHTNLIAFAFAPFYWLGAGPEFLYIVQAVVLGAGAVPTYLIARERLTSTWAAGVIALAFLMYAPVQWLAQNNFHPEALVVTPLLFAWWCGLRRNWRWCFVSIVLALSTREDTAMAVFMMGLALAWMMWRAAGADRRHHVCAALSVSALGVGWYFVCMRLLIPYFNRGQEPFYIGYFYGNYGNSTSEIVWTMVRHPNRVVSDATQPDRLRFYRDLLLPWGGLPLGGVVQLAMALPQMLASVIGLSPYARMIRFQYTSVMIAPIVIAAVEGVALAWRYRIGRRVVLPWIVACMYVSNVAWSPSPLGAEYDAAWAERVPRHATIDEALTLIPEDAAVTASYSFVPHLSHRRELYDWPNPWVQAYWGNDDGYRLPDPSSVEYVVLDRRLVSDEHRPLLDQLVGPNGEFVVLFDWDDIVVGRRADLSATP